MITLYPESNFPSDLLICTKNGKSPTERNMQISFDRIFKRAGLPHMGTYALRHTFAIELLKRASSLSQLKEVAELMDEDYNVTIKTYLHTDDTAKFDLVDKLAM